MRRSPLSEEARFRTYLVEGDWPEQWTADEPPSEPCLLWTGGTSSGYGRFRLTGDGHGGIRKQAQAHVYAWELENGSIPLGAAGNRQVPDHLCRNPLCCRVSHLEVKSYGDNYRSGFRANGTSIALECLSGHLYADHGVVTRQNGREFRRCMVCHEAARARYLARKAATA